MALTLTITSFTCTFPVVGGLMVMAAGGQYFYPVIGLATFATVLALPFFLLALAPGLLSQDAPERRLDERGQGRRRPGRDRRGVQVPQHGRDRPSSTPEDAWFDAQVVLSIWVVLAVVCGIYLLGLFRTDHDHDEVKVGPGRILIGSLFLGLALYLAPALFGQPPPEPDLRPLVVGHPPGRRGELDAAPARGAGGGARRVAGGQGPVDRPGGRPRAEERPRRRLGDELRGRPEQARPRTGRS